MAKLGGLHEEFASRAVFVEAMVSDITQLYYMPGPKMIGHDDAKASFARALKDLPHGVSLRRIVRDQLIKNDQSRVREFLKEPYSRPHTVITFDLSYLDFGLSKNVTSTVYEGYLKEKALPMDG